MKNTSPREGKSVRVTVICAIDSTMNRKNSVESKRIFFMVFVCTKIYDIPYQEVWSNSHNLWQSIHTKAIFEVWIAFGKRK